MIKTGVMLFGFAPVFYISKLVEILKDTFIMELNMESENGKGISQCFLNIAEIEDLQMQPEIILGVSGTVEAGTFSLVFSG